MPLPRGGDNTLTGAEQRCPTAERHKRHRLAIITFTTLSPLFLANQPSTLSLLGSVYIYRSVYIYQRITKTCSLGEQVLS
jgi:hypothetical protein